MLFILLSTMMLFIEYLAILSFVCGLYACVRILFFKLLISDRWGAIHGIHTRQHSTFFAIAYRQKYSLGTFNDQLCKISYFKNHRPQVLLCFDQMSNNLAKSSPAKVLLFSWVALLSTHAFFIQKSPKYVNFWNIIYTCGTRSLKEGREDLISQHIRRFLYFFQPLLT